MFAKPRSVFSWQQKDEWINAYICMKKPRAPADFVNIILNLKNG
jgi:hypothetical protein